MGLDDAPAEKRLKFADGGSADDKKKRKKEEIGAAIGGALAGVVGAGAAYMAYKRHNKQQGAGFNPQQGGPGNKANALMSDRPGGYKGEMSHDAQQEYLDRFQDTESPAYMKKLQDFQNHGQPQASGLTIDYAQKKSF